MLLTWLKLDVLVSWSHLEIMFEPLNNAAWENLVREQNVVPRSALRESPECNVKPTQTAARMYIFHLELEQQSSSCCTRGQKLSR